MITSLRDIMVVADIDGTLLTDDHELLRSNLETIRLFTLLGGRFTLATGRLPQSIANYAELRELIGPAITCGGSILYDFAADRPIKTWTLPRLTAHLALSDVLKAFPAVGATVAANDMRLYLAAHNAYTQQYVDGENIIYFERPNEEIPPEWNKLLFAGTPELLSEVIAFTAQRTYPGAQFISTNKIYYELMPQGISKGSALRELCALVDIPIENTIVIGDYYNDLEMMREAGHSVAMGNAPSEVAMAADEMTGTNQEGGVGLYLYKLIRQYG